VSAHRRKEQILFEKEAKSFICLANEQKFLVLFSKKELLFFCRRTP